MIIYGWAGGSYGFGNYDSIYEQVCLVYVVQIKFLTWADFRTSSPYTVLQLTE